MMAYKQCTRCRKVKPFSSFSKDNTRPQGLRYWCRDCDAQKSKKYRRKEMKDPLFRLKKNINKQMKASLNGQEKGKRWLELVDWNFKQLVKHLEAQFQPNMSWGNYGKWHLDHIKPIYEFDITDANCKAFKECWALTNLQPLWAHQNQIKGKSSFSNRFFEENEGWEVNENGLPSGDT